MKVTKISIQVFVILTALVFSCQKGEKEIERDYLTNFINTLHIKNSTQWVIILPGLGCHGCIQEGEQFMKENVNNENVYFMLTSIESIKILQHKIGVELRKQNNVYMDTENKIDIPTNNNIYPCIIQMEKGKIKEHEFQSPANSAAFFKLQSRIKEMN